ncbi:hypothetical protein GGR57DRAFT_500802 [Xylariaceae sp. FL1272]|nr:hypothetical protein GGR57DRAFT_500802 [Xylariaceae sp. FL1272]
MQINICAIFTACEVASLLAMAIAASPRVDSLTTSQYSHAIARSVAHADYRNELSKRAAGNPVDARYACHDPHQDIFGPAPPVEDCQDVINQYSTLTAGINVKLVEGCYQLVSGNCTGLVCPQREGESTMPGSVAAQFMQKPLLEECIAAGKRGWWIDGRNWGIGIYLT